MSKNRKKARKNGKSLLNERTIRRWQSLAAINEMGSYGEAYDGEEREDEMPDLEGEDEMPDFGDEDEMPDFGGEDEMSDDPDSMDADSIEISPETLSAAQPLLQALVGAADQMAGEEGEDLDDEFGDELTDPIGGDEDEMPDFGDEEEDEEEDEEPNNQLTTPKNFLWGFFWSNYGYSRFI